jgi:2-oxoglutarate dehydrogenase E2 component (dihydrolipoamide succinyltransferase)
MSSNIVVPEMGESIVDARIAKWLRQEGDAVSVGEPLVELETDKVDVEVAAPQSGVLASIVHKDGADVKIGDVLGTIEEGRRQKAEGRNQDKAEGRSEKGKGKGKGDAVAATPAARRLARQENVDLSTVTPEGPRVTPDDIKSAKPAPAASSAKAPAETQAKAPAATPAPKPSNLPTFPRPVSERSEERVRMSKRRATIARRLVEAQATAAMLTTFNEVDMTAVQQLRERRKAAFKERHGVSLGLSSFFVKATVAALREFPRLNAEIQGDEMVLKQY